MTTTARRSRGVRYALLLALCWAASWGLLGAGPRPLGIPLVTWAHLGLGVLAIGVNLRAVFAPGSWEEEI